MADEELSQAQRLEEIQQALEGFRSLVKSRAWERLVEIAEAQIEARQKEILQPRPSMDEILRGEGLKGELAGIKIFLALPSNIVENLERKQRALLEALRRNENAN